jgi:hypothetical protein
MTEEERIRTHLKREGRGDEIQGKATFERDCESSSEYAAGKPAAIHA